MSEGKTYLSDYLEGEECLKIIKQSGLMDNAEVVKVVDSENSVNMQWCQGFGIDYNNGYVDFLIGEKVKYFQVIHYRVDFNKLNFNKFFTTLINQLSDGLLAQIIEKMLCNKELKSKLYRFIKNKSNKLSEDERIKLGKILAKYDEKLATKLLI